MEPRLTTSLTERRALPRDPVEVRRLLASIVESSQDAIYAKDLNGTITSWNASAQRVYGYTPDEALGRSVAMLVPPGGEDDFLSLLARLRQGEGVQNYESVRMAKGGRRIPVSLTISLIRDDRGQVIGASTIARDISPRKLEESRWRWFAEIGSALSGVLDAEELLRELARTVVQELADYCVTYLVTGDTVRRVGTAHADPSRASLVRRLCELNPVTLQDAMGAGAVIRTGEPMVMTEIGSADLLRASGGGEYFEVLTALEPISSMVLPLGARGRTQGAIAFAMSTHSNRHYTEADVAFGREIADRAAMALDNARLFDEAQAEIARREAAEAALRQRFEALRVINRLTEAVSHAEAVEEIFDQTLEGLTGALGVTRASILLFDPDEVLRFKAWRGLSDGYRAAVEGHTPWSPQTQSPTPIVIPNVLASADLTEPVRSHILGEGIQGLAFFPIVFRTRLLGKFMLYFDSPRGLTAGEIELAQTIGGAIGFAISKVQDDHSVREARALAERASEAKSQFLGIMSHELRTPLNAVLGYGDLLLLETKGPLTEGQREQVTRIRSSAMHQLALVEELLTYTRLEAGREEARLVDTDARRVVTDVVELIRPQADAKKLAVRVDLPSSPLTLLTDPGKLRQIALNFASNAVKYTDSGEIRIHPRCIDGHFTLSVTDTGAGIPAEKLEHIFEPFVQVDQSRTRVAGGTGLGLAIARRFATLLGGTVAVQSRVGFGSTFTLTLPNACIGPHR